MSKSFPFAPHPAWTNAKFFGHLRSALRRLWMHFPPRSECIRLSRRKAPDDVRHKWEAQCAQCGGWFRLYDVQADHKEPCGSLRCWDDIGPFCERMFCGADGLQAVCKPCHREITTAERKAAKEARENATS